MDSNEALIEAKAVIRTQPDDARNRLNKLIQDYPNTSEARTAQGLVKSLEEAIDHEGTKPHYNVLPDVIIGGLVGGLYLYYFGSEGGGKGGVFIQHFRIIAIPIMIAISFVMALFILPIWAILQPFRTSTNVPIISMLGALGGLSITLLFPEGLSFSKEIEKSVWFLLIPWFASIVFAFSLSNLLRTIK